MTIQIEEEITITQSKTNKCLKKLCSVKTVKKRLPIIGWLPKYKSEYILQDIIAGITVGLTAIPQGIAYAIIAGLPPEYGLYASLTSGVVYVIFGSCYNVTVGPTAILSAMVAKYVMDYSVDFAILTAFLTGVFMFLTGVLNLGFLVQFISMPVINGFTTAAALQIAATQLKFFFGTAGSTGNYFAESIYNFVTNIKTVKFWEPILSVATMVMLILLKKLGEGSKLTDGFTRQARWFISLSRNAVVVIVGMILAYILQEVFDLKPFSIIEDIGRGLPTFSWPPFSTTVGNTTYDFVDMVQILGFQSIVIPFVATIETVAVGKAFAEAGRIDASQEMIAVGLCNIIGSFGLSLPVTGSFTRTALNEVSGVKTPAGGVSKVVLLIVALTFLTNTFYYIPKASLAGIIMVAMFTMIDYHIAVRLWRSSKIEFLLFLVTTIVCLSSGLEYGIIAGILLEACLLLYNTARPIVEIAKLKSVKGNIIVVNLCGNVMYCAAEHVRQKLLKASAHGNENTPIVINGDNLKKLDYTAAFNFIAIVKDISKTNHVLLLNFNVELKNFCVAMDPSIEPKFVYAANPLELNDVFPKEV